MKQLEDLGVLGLNTRLKRLSDILYRQIDEIYKQENIEFSSRSFSLLYLLHENESMSVTELASTLGQTHPAISQMSKKLEQKGWIYHHLDEKDDRKRMLSVTPQGFDLFDRVSPIWNDLKTVIGRLMSTSGGNIMQNVDLMERQLEQQDLKTRMADLRRERVINSVEIIHYENQFANDFYQLNRAWLEKYFYMEEVDEDILSNPMERIIEPGGFVLLARLKSEIIGTAALIKNQNNELELSKMAVRQDYHGVGIGEKLALAAIQQYEATDFEKLYLESNRQLVPAINLYSKLGFVEEESPFEQSHYTRADIYMVYQEETS